MEMFKLTNSICQRFNQRIYVATDELSKQKAINFEAGYGNKSPEVIFTTRSRDIGKSIFESVPKILLACLEAFKIVLIKRPNLVLCNGPGTCIPICIAAFVFDLLRLIDCRIIYVESVCRVQSLSLSGKLLYYSQIYDGFLVQWPELKQKFGRTEYLGRFS
ncbi:UDP-N-acetylglucosamine transferase subunit ALG14-like protein [Aphelenchoides bicaudatus]|nr:UDP-N-acetylglucosamine transferase subunit ALG14-like protein [Aphelenchoides bicaudatus]